MRHCTISENSAINGGGINSNGIDANSVAITLQNTILANNSASNSGPDLLVTGIDNVTTTDDNLLSSLDGHSLTETDITLTTDPKLAPLGDYGGPTQTMPPHPDSPAIDAGGSSDPGRNDQRGFPRFINKALDIGAVERGNLPSR